MWTLRILKETIKYQTIGGFLFRLGAVRRSFSYEEAKKIYIEGLAIGQLVERGGLPNAEKFEEMLYRMNIVR